MFRNIDLSRDVCRSTDFSSSKTKVFFVLYLQKELYISKVPK